MLEELLEKVEEVVEDLTPATPIVAYRRAEMLEEMGMTESQIKEMIKTVDDNPQRFGVKQRRAVERMRKLFF